MANYNKILKNIGTIIFLQLVLLQICWGLTLKYVSDNQTINLSISDKEITQIFVTKDRIQSVHGDAGSYILKSDSETGTIFIKPSYAYEKRDFSVFLTTENERHFTLKFKPNENLKAGIVELRPTTAVYKKASKWEASSPYEIMLVELLKGMVNGNVPDGYAVSYVAKVKSIKHKCLTITLLKTFQGAHVVGEIFCIQNRTRQPIEITEEDFYQAGTRAISVDHQVLQPNQSTYLYRIISYDN